MDNRGQNYDGGSPGPNYRPHKPTSFTPNFYHDGPRPPYCAPPSNIYPQRMYMPNFKDRNPHEHFNMPWCNRPPLPPHPPPNFPVGIRPPPFLPDQQFQNQSSNVPCFPNKQDTGYITSSQSQPVPQLNTYPEYIESKSDPPNCEINQDHTDVSVMDRGDCEKDLNWVRSWIALKGVKQGVKPPDQQPALKMREAQHLLSEALHLLESLKTAQSKSDFSACSKLMGRLQALEGQLTEDNNLEALGAHVDRVAKKRIRLKKKRKAEYIEREQIEESRRLKHAAIDNWLENIVKKEHDAKKEKQLKAAADETLKEVRRKLADVTRTQECLKALKKLRQVRADRMTNQGLPPPKEIECAFNERTECLSEQLSIQKKMYEAEKKSLEVMLESEQEEIAKKERRILKKKQERDRQKQEKPVTTLLFGPKETLSEESPMLPFTQYYLGVESNPESLVQIRQEWDRFLVDGEHPGGAAIPPGWVVPSQPSSNTWATYVKSTL